MSGNSALDGNPLNLLDGLILVDNLLRLVCQKLKHPKIELVKFLGAELIESGCLKIFQTHHLLHALPVPGFWFRSRG